MMWQVVNLEHCRIMDDGALVGELADPDSLSIIGQLNNENHQ